MYEKITDQLDIVDWMDGWSVEQIAGLEENLSHENQIDYQQYWECNSLSQVSHVIWI